MSRHQNAGQNHNIKVSNKSLEIVAKFKYMSTTATNRIYIHEEIKDRSNLGNVFYHSVHKLLTSHLVAENLKTKTHESITLPTILCGCETWYLTSREEH